MDLFAQPFAGKSADLLTYGATPVTERTFVRTAAIGLQQDDGVDRLTVLIAIRKNALEEGRRNVVKIRNPRTLGCSDHSAIALERDAGDMVQFALLQPSQIGLKDVAKDKFAFPICDDVNHRKEPAQSLCLIGHVRPTHNDPAVWFKLPVDLGDCGEAI